MLDSAPEVVVIDTVATRNQTDLQRIKRRMNTLFVIEVVIGCVVKPIDVLMTADEDSTTDYEFLLCG